MMTPEANALIMAKMRNALSLQDQVGKLPEGTILTISAGKLTIIHGRDGKPVMMPQIMGYLRDNA